MPSHANIRVGVGGWTFAPWRNNFYPQDLVQKRELEYASRKFTSIEINGTYYGSQKPDSFAKWHDETPEDFVFAVKGSRFTTNRRVLAEAQESVDRFFASGVMALKNKLGPINWQFMPTKKLDLADFEGFLKCLPKRIDGRDIRHAVEVRHASFADAAFVSLTKEYGVAVVFAADSAFPQIADLTAPFVYARIMGTTEAEETGYAKPAVEHWARQARDWAAGRTGSLPTLIQPPRPAPHDVFLYVISGHKPHNPAAATAIIKALS